MVRCLHLSYVDSKNEFWPRSFRWSEANGEIGAELRPLHSPLKGFYRGERKRNFKQEAGLKNLPLEFYNSNFYDGTDDEIFLVF